MAEGSHGEPCCFALLVCQHVEATTLTILLGSTILHALSP